MVKEIHLDLWKTDAHKVEVGIKKQAEHQAKSRQFTKDTDVIGEYKFKDSDTKGYVTIRTDPWNAEKNEQRLILKVFTESMNWKGSLEELVADGLTRTIATKRGFPVFIVNLTNLDHLVRLERVMRPKFFNKPIYSFMLLKDGKLQPYRVEEDRLTMGSDFKVYNKYNQEIAEIDGAAMNLGGKWDIRLNDEDFDLHPALDEVLILFCSLIKFEDDVKNRLEEVADKIDNQEPDYDIVIDKEEVDLYDNPRRVKY